MKAIIIEDESVAAQALESLITDTNPSIEVTAVLQTVDESIDWFETHSSPDLVFMDIHLADGSSFAIFDKIRIECPIIFTTAYDEYALKAFEVNSIDYLLKPIDKAHLDRALDKYRNLQPDSGKHNDIIASLVSVMNDRTQTYKSSLLVAALDKLVPVPVREIEYIHTENKIVHAVTSAGSSYVLDLTMEELTKQLSPRIFFRANRQYIVARGAIKDISAWFGNKLVSNLHKPAPDRISVSRSLVKEFKKWLTE